MQVSKKRGGTTAFIPGVAEDGELLWQGTSGNHALSVNSKAPGNAVGDILIDINGPTDQLLHADWGRLDLDLMVVFDSTSDEQIWNSNPPSATCMADRDSLTGFGLVVGMVNNVSPFVLIPENQP